MTSLLPAEVPGCIVLSCQLMPLTPKSKGFAELLDESRRSGFRMLARFEEGWSSGTNRFDRPGEMMLGAFAEAKLIGAGGRSIDPYDGDPRVGRLRHVYVAQNSRGLGIGHMLIAQMLADAGNHFTQIRVRAPVDAFGFYEHLGFARVVGREAVTHSLWL
jgi:GNAT superfamily N-acetyltransferase